MTDAQHTLYLWHVERTNEHDYDEFSDFVVVSSSVYKAKVIMPGPHATTGEYGSWVTPDKVRVTRIGIAAKELEEGQVICASFHAG